MTEDPTSPEPPLPAAADALLERLYHELKDIAARELKRERADHTLVPTALVHEAYVKLADQHRVEWQGETHFRAVAAQAMKRILIDHARGKGRQKRGGAWRKVPLDVALPSMETPAADPAELFEALERMRALDERQARVVELRLLGGLSCREAARVMDVSVRTVERDWLMGRTWLRRELKGDDDGEPGDVE